MTQQSSPTGIRPDSRVAHRVLDILVTVTGSDEVRQDLDLALLDLHILDSLGMAEVLLSISETFGVDISPSEINRAQWISPRTIIAFVEERVR